MLENQDNPVHALEISIEQAKAAVNLKDDLFSLLDNKAFINVVTQGYFKDEASRLVLAKALPNMQDGAMQAKMDNDIIAIGRLNQYFSGITGMGYQAEKAIRDAQEEIVEINKGEVA